MCLNEIAERFVLDEQLFNRLKDMNAYATREMLENWRDLKKRVEEKWK
jgi:hypothetical protein